jgi:hypothetical protein
MPTSAKTPTQQSNRYPRYMNPPGFHAHPVICHPPVAGAGLHRSRLRTRPVVYGRAAQSRGWELLEQYAAQVRETVLAAGELTLATLTLYRHTMACADRILAARADDLPEGLIDRPVSTSPITAACWIAREQGLL